MNEFERVRRKILISSGKPSYAILTNNSSVNFELENTPMSNFQVSSATVTINGTSYSKSLIKEIYFGSSYEQVTSIGNNFIRGYAAITSVDLSAFVNVTSIGYNFLYECSNLTYVNLSAFRKVNSINYSFLYGCYSLPSVDLSAFVNVTSIGNSFITNCINITSVDLSNSTKIENISVGFINYCASMTTLHMGTIVPPTNGGQLFQGSSIQNIYVPSQSVNAYKTAAGWSTFASIISAI